MFKKISSAAIIISSLLYAAVANADVVNFAWDPVNDARVAKYELCYGTATATYATSCVETLAPQTTSSNEIPKGTWFAAVRACTTDKSLCSDWSNEVTFKTLGPIAPPTGLKVDISININ